MVELPVKEVQEMTDGDSNALPDESGVVELDYEECLRRLGTHVVGRIALVIDGMIVIVPVNYRLVREGGKTWIAFRTRDHGILDRTNIHAAFEIDEDHAKFHTGWSVLAQGTLHRVDPDAADFRERYDSRPWPGSKRDRWMVLEPFSITGRRIEQRNDWTQLSGGQPGAS
jgi:nitroimidazol reductase NimA-like FMN-containing flavoprotein (pyridoxamine 5'-phosphate oxidase superfamily)